VFAVTGVDKVIALEPHTKIDPEGDIIGEGAERKSM
jgi:hypothetical protein